MVSADIIDFRVSPGIGKSAESDVPSGKTSNHVASDINGDGSADSMDLTLSGATPIGGTLMSNVTANNVLCKTANDLSGGTSLSAEKFGGGGSCCTTR